MVATSLSDDAVRTKRTATAVTESDPAETLGQGITDREI
jgi:hypothetical protein